MGKLGEEERQGEVAHLIIDVHRKFCDPSAKDGYGTDKTLAAARKIGRLAEHFRRAGIPNYFIYLPAIWGMAMKRGPLFIKPAPQDRLVRKWHSDAFSSGKIENSLRKEKMRTLLVSGFNRSACVRQTVEHALRKGYKVYLIEDAVEDDKRFTPPEKYKDKSLQAMMEKGARIIDTETAINLFPVHA